VSEVVSFDEGVEGARSVTRDRLLLELDGYAGPIDVLLELARDQKVDLKHIRILDLAEQYLEFVREARALRLELAADYLVMAAWLAYLKSRLLLPETGTEEEPSGAEMAAALKFQMQRLQAMRDAGERLMALRQLDHDVFRRGTPERPKTRTITTYDATLFDLLKAYGRNRAQSGPPEPADPAERALFGRPGDCPTFRPARRHPGVADAVVLPAAGPARRSADAALGTGIDLCRDPRNV